MGMLYRHILRPWLFLLDPERAHELITDRLKRVMNISIAPSVAEAVLNCSDPLLQSTVDGLSYPNPVGLAAGFDKTGELYPVLSHMGFGFLETGTFTRMPQEGNPQPRLFRYPDYGALINRMGFNNPGAAHAAVLFSHQDRSIPRGINIGKSKVASLDEASEDYNHSLRLLVPHADYITINISSPNTPGLRDLQEEGRLRDLLGQIKQTLITIRKENDPSAPDAPSLPVYVKVAPDLSNEGFDSALTVIDQLDLSGVIISNTTISREMTPVLQGGETGGLSGIPLRPRSTELIYRAYEYFQGRKTIMGSGGIFSGADALEKIRSGANLVQIYTGYIYEGPMLPCEINRYLYRVLKRDGITLAELVGSGHRR